jgi:hypothetical protein
MLVVDSSHPSSESLAMKFCATFMLLLIAGPFISPCTAADPPPPLRIATFQADVTPPLGTPLCHGNVKPAKEIVDRLSARGIILLTEKKPIVLCSVDWVAISNTSHDEFREAIAQAAGTTADRVSVHTVHQHDTPGIDFMTDELLAKHGLGGRMFDPVPARDAIERTAQAAKKALEHTHPVTHLGCGVGKVEKVASNRRILDADGKCIMTRMSSCRKEKAIAAPEGLIDPFVRLISFWDGDRALASLTYYACHPQSYYGRGGVSYDFVGMARAQREAALPEMPHIHFNGAGGNIAAGKYNDGSPKMRPILADRLAAGMKAAWEDAQKTPVRAGDVDWRVVPVQLPVRKTLIEKELLQKVKNEDLKQSERIRSARELCWLRRMKSGHQIELGALRIGPARVLHMPGELCIEYQLAAQSFRPDAFVAMAAYADDGMCYICTEIAYSQGGYEPGRASRVAPEVEGVLMGAIREMLED